MSDNFLNVPEIDTRIAFARENLRQLIEQAAALSGATNEELMARRTADQEQETEGATRSARRKQRLARAKKRWFPHRESCNE